MSRLNIQQLKSGKVKGGLTPSSSKSISNRLLIINALSGNRIKIENLSVARDTILLQQALSSNELELDIKDAGTAMRFLTAYFAVTGQEKILNGTSRMQERPIGILVEALQTLGAKIEYLNKSGFPPLKFIGFQQNMSCEELLVDASVSSQYITALLLIAPYLKDGLKLKYKTEVSSMPYIDMTISLMEYFGISVDKGTGGCYVHQGNYKATTYAVEADWSAASYWYGFAALAKEAEIQIIGLHKNSIQGDSAVIDIYARLGIRTAFNNKGVLLTKSGDLVKELNINFADTPDIAQTIFVTTAALGVKLKATGLRSLRIKETDRLEALKIELAKIGAKLIVGKNDNVELIPSEVSIPSCLNFSTYEDHRMAMSFAPLALLANVEFDNSLVVRKSYPTFWDDLKKLGFVVS